MRKTQDAFAFRELYQKCYREDFKSQEETNAANEFYEKFLLKGFSLKCENDRAQASYYSFKQELYKSDRADFIVNIINRHLARLKKMEGNENISRTRLADLREKYLGMFETFKETAINFGEIGRANWIAFKRIFAQEFGERLRIARRRAGLSQERLAAKINISQESYSRYELGAREPPLGIIYELSIILNVSVDWLFCRIPITE